MRTLALLLSFLFVLNAHAVKTPFQPKDEKLLSENVMLMADKAMVIGNSSGKAIPESLGVDGSFQKRIARATYDVAVDGGTIAAHLLGVKLPANSIIVRSWFYTVTQFVDAGVGTVALHCEDANNIYSAADITGIAVGSFTSGVQDDAIANFTGSIAAECELTATVATAAQTAGKLVLFVEYMVVE